MREKFTAITDKYFIETKLLKNKKYEVKNTRHGLVLYYPTINEKSTLIEYTGNGTIYDAFDLYDEITALELKQHILDSKVLLFRYLMKNGITIECLNSLKFCSLIHTNGATLDLDSYIEIVRDYLSSGYVDLNQKVDDNFITSMFYKAIIRGLKTWNIENATPNFVGDRVHNINIQKGLDIIRKEKKLLEKTRIENERKINYINEVLTHYFNIIKDKTMCYNNININGLEFKKSNNISNIENMKQYLSIFNDLNVTINTNMKYFPEVTIHECMDINIIHNIKETCKNSSITFNDLSVVNKIKKDKELDRLSEIVHSENPIHEYYYQKLKRNNII